MAQLNIAILGAGIAGLCTAIACHQKGFKVTLYERSTKIKVSKNNGVGLVLWPNASSVLAKLNILEDIAVSGYTLENMERYTKSGQFINDLNFKSTNHNNPQAQFKNYAIKRHTLHSKLLNTVSKLNIAIHYDYRVSRIISNTNQSTLVYFDNLTKISADIIVGADGRMNSITRKYVAGNNRAIYQGYVNWVGLIEQQTAITFDKSIIDYWGCGERFAIVPLSPHSAYWAGCKTLNEKLGEPEAGNKNTLLSIFKDWPDSIHSILKHSSSQHIHRIEVYDHDPLPLWHRDNVCLIGDAAHAALPTSGQGACQAIEDAYYLAEELAKLENNNIEHIQSAFTNFYKIRFQLTQDIATNARFLARTIFNTDPEFCRERDQKAKNSTTV